MVVLDNLGYTPAIAERELEAIERYLGDALTKLLQEDTDEGNGHSKQPMSVPLS